LTDIGASLGATERDEEKRSAFRERLKGVEASRLVFVDESSTNVALSWGDVLGYDTQRRSIDVWSKGGRGTLVGRRNGTRALMRVFCDPNLPWIAWCIWRGRLWTPEDGGVYFDDDGTGLHFDHPHITFQRRGTWLLTETTRFLALQQESLEVLEAGWEVPREEAFWNERPDSSERYVKANGLWVPVS
jgi:hypothetical protein